MTTKKKPGVFHPGDIVRLIAGGPDMAVDEVVAALDNIVKCSWFAGKKRETGHFVPATLEHVDRDSDGATDT